MFSKITSWRQSKILAFVLAVAVFLSAFYGLVPTLNIAEALGEDDAASITEDTSVVYWDGDTSATVAGMAGSGESAEDPKLIYTGAELYAAVNCTTATYFKLMNDIVLQKDATHAAKVDALLAKTSEDTEGLLEWIGSSANFIGNFDGNHKTVSSMYFNSSTTSVKGLFYQLYAPAVVTNLTIKDAHITNHGRVGALAGNACQGTGRVTVSGVNVLNCFVKSTASESAGGFFGGAFLIGLDMSYCVYDKGQYGSVAAATAKNHGAIFGIIHDNSGANGRWHNNDDSIVDNENRGISLRECVILGGYTITSCAHFLHNNQSGYAAGVAHDCSNVYTDYPTESIALGITTNTPEYATSYLRPQNWQKFITDTTTTKGSLVYENLATITPSRGWIVPTEGAAPIYVGVENLSKYNYVTPVWTGKTLTYDKLLGEGTAASPKLVSIGSELYAATRCTADGVYFKLMNDIVLQTPEGAVELDKLLKGDATADLSKLNNWEHTAAAKFNGKFDGNFKTVSGLYLSSTSTANPQGLFQAVGGPDNNSGTNTAIEISNLTIKDSVYKTASATAALIGTASRASQYGAKPEVNITGCRVENCHLETTSTAVGGFIGNFFFSKNNITNCVYVKGPQGCLTSTSYYGAVHGDSWSNSAYRTTLTNFISIGAYIANKDFNPAEQGLYSESQISYHCTNVYTSVATQHDRAVFSLSEDKLTGVNAYFVKSSVFSPETGWVLLDENSTLTYVGEGNAENYDYIPVPNYWTGDTTVKVEDMKGDGTQDSPKLIYNGAELYAAVRCTTDGIYFKLMKDIELQTPDGMVEFEKLLKGEEADLSKLNNWEHTTEAKFNGKFDGNFKTITGMYISTTSTVSQGLFSAVGGPSNNSGINTEINIANVTVKNAVVKGAGNAAALIGTAARASQYGVKPVVNITGCRVENCHIETTGDNAAGFMGLLFFARVNLIDCAYIKGDNGVLTSKTNKGSIHGDHHNNYTPNGFGLTVTRYMSVGEWPASKGVWTTTDTAQYYTPVIAYTDQTNASVGTFITVSSAQMKGQDAYASMSALIPKNGWIVENNDSYPIYVGAENVSKYDYLPLPTYWTGNETTIATAFADQAGKGNSADTPYEIWNGDQLYAAVNSSEALYFKLMADINLQNAAGMQKVRALITNPEGDTQGLNNWGTVSAIFKGHFDGNFKTVSGLYLSSSAGATEGFFTQLDAPAVVKNLTIKDAYFKNNGAVGGLAGVVASAGNAGGTVDISGCRVENIFIESSGGAGAAGYFGVVHHVGLKVTNCLFDRGQGMIVKYGGKDWQGNVTAGGNCVGALCGDFYSMTGRYADDGGTIPTQGANYAANLGFEIKNFISFGGYTISSKTAMCNNNEQGWANGSAFDSYGVYFETYAANKTEFTAPIYGVYNSSGNNKTNKEWLISQDASKMIGAAAYENMPTITPARGWVVLEENGKPIYVGADNVDDYDYLAPTWTGKKALGPTGNNYYTVESRIANNADSTQPLVPVVYLAGEGTDAKPYLVFTATELFVALQNTEEGKVFSLMNDINLSNNDWNATATDFTGTINGNGYTISKLKSNDALIPRATTVVINNLHLRDVTINANSSAAAFVQKSTGTATFNGCSLKDFSISAVNIVGGFILDTANDSTVPAVFNNCLIASTEDGSLAGTAYGFRAFGKASTVKNSIAQGVESVDKKSIGNAVYVYDANGNSTLYKNAKTMKARLTADQKAALSEYFYWDDTTSNVPMLKNASCAVANDVDGDEKLTTADAGALKGILLLDTSFDQVKTDNFDKNEGIDILDVVALYNAAK